VTVAESDSSSVAEAQHSVMRRRAVRSSVLVSVGYDEETAVLEITFVDGGVYRYFEVPSAVYDGLMSASSHGKYFDANVKEGGYRYTKIR
jgi:hypothetical protein